MDDGSIFSFCRYKRKVRGCVRVPEGVWGPGSALMMFGACVGGGGTAAEVVVAELDAAFLSDSGVSLVMKAAPGEVSFLSAG